MVGGACRGGWSMSWWVEHVVVGRDMDTMCGGT